MRFQIDQQIWTLCVHLPDAFMYPSYSRFYGYDKDLPFPELEFRKLTVTEHHRVLNEYAAKDSAPDCDGFILKGDDGSIWHNQYPRAGYGQLDDSQDGIFTISTNAKGEDCQKLIVDWMNSLPKGVNEKSPFVFETFNLFRELRTMRRSLHGLETGDHGVLMGGDREPETERGVKLRSFYDYVLVQFEKQTGLKIDSKPHVFEHEGKQKVLPGWFDHFIVGQETEA